MASTAARTSWKASFGRRRLRRRLRLISLHRFHGRAHVLVGQGEGNLAAPAPARTSRRAGPVATAAASWPGQTRSQNSRRDAPHLLPFQVGEGRRPMPPVPGCRPRSSPLRNPSPQGRQSPARQRKPRLLQRSRWTRLTAMGRVQLGHGLTGSPGHPGSFDLRAANELGRRRSGSRGSQCSECRSWCPPGSKGRGSQRLGSERLPTFEVETLHESRAEFRRRPRAPSNRGQEGGVGARRGTLEPHPGGARGGSPGVLTPTPVLHEEVDRTSSPRIPFEGPSEPARNAVSLTGEGLGTRRVEKSQAGLEPW